MTIPFLNGAKPGFGWSNPFAMGSMMIKSIICIDNYICNIRPLLKFCGPEIALKRNFFACFCRSLPTFGGEPLSDAASLICANRKRSPSSGSFLLPPFRLILGPALDEKDRTYG
ncbi:hypothetical protein CO667_16885 [Rhizobium sp. L43]|nr:hypothetical protein CO667_16885 [Rhizobium sp. L43]